MPLKKQLFLKIKFLIAVFLLAGCDFSQKDDLILSEQTAFHHAVVFGPVHSTNDTPPTAYNEMQYFTPASCQKVVTGLLFYKVLGPDFRYTTSLYKSGGEIILSFTGDPTLTSADVYQLLSSLKGKRFPGCLIIDHSTFQLPEWSENWMIDDIGSGGFFSPVSAAILDHNFVELEISPTKPGYKAKLDAISPVPYQFSVMTLDQAQKQDQNQALPSPSIEMFWKKNVLHITGTVSPKDGRLMRKISPPSSQFFLEAKLRKILKDLNIHFAKGLEFISKVSSLPSDKVFLNKHESQRLVEFLPQAMKSSDNLVFDSLYLTLLRKMDPTCKTWREGDKVIKQAAIQYLSLDLGKSFIVDGSGASRYNRLQPLLLWKILQKGYGHKEFINFLAYPGERNSTLQKRGGLPSGIRAKTGTLSGISCLCGYHLDGENPEAFVLQFDHFPPPLKDILSTQEAILNKRYVTKL